MLGPSTSPQIVVHMPADAKPLSQLTEHPKVIGPDRAILWWTVYERSLHETTTDRAALRADQAVMTVYGPLPTGANP